MFQLSAAHGGLSPRVRGNRNQVIHVRWRIGSIPACAGEPCSWSPGGGLPGVYPRVCGGTGNVKDIYGKVWGLSPRVRGNLL